MAMKGRMPGGARDQITSLSVMARQAGETGKWDSALLPTPSAADGLGGHERRGGARTEELLLAGIAKDVTQGPLLPTPTTQPSTGNGHARDLGREVRTLPTPQARDGHHNRGADPERYRGSKSQNGRRSNLDDMIAATEAGRWSGESTEPPSSDTSECSVEQLRIL